MALRARYLDLYVETMADFGAFLRGPLLQVQREQQHDYPTIYFVYPRKNGIGIGYNSQPGRDVDLAFCAANDITVKRSSFFGGLGALQHTGTVFVGVTGHQDLPLFDRTSEEIYRKNLEIFAGVCREAWGIDCFYRPLNDVDLPSGKKFSGSGLIRDGEYVDFMFTLFADRLPPGDFLERCVPQPKEKFGDKKAKNLHERVTTLEAEAGRKVGLDELRRVLLGALVKTYDLELELSPLTEREIALEQQLRLRTDTKEYLNAKTEASRFAGFHGQRGEHTHKCPSGPLIRATVLVNQGRIARVLLSGAYVGVQPFNLTDRIQHALEGVPAEHRAIADQVESHCAAADVHLSQCTPDDFINTIVSACNAAAL